MGGDNKSGEHHGNQYSGLFFYYSLGGNMLLSRAGYTLSFATHFWFL